MTCGRAIQKKIQKNTKEYIKNTKKGGGSLFILKLNKGNRFIRLRSFGPSYFSYYDFKMRRDPKVCIPIHEGGHTLKRN